MEIIIGAAVSLLVQWLKGFGKNQWHTLAMLLAISIGAAGVYTYLVEAGFWQSIVGILMVAGTFYAFILQRFEA